MSLACLALLRVPPRPLPAPGSFLADLGEGWHELAVRPWYWINLLAHACGNFASLAFFVLGPVIALRLSRSVALIAAANTWFVITPVGFAVAGPLASSLGFTATLVGAAALVVLVPGVRGVRRTPA